jgi:flavorubredoxin
MKAYIVVESMFGNSRQVADAVAAGMREAAAEVEVVEVTQAPERVPDDVELLVVGGPTHAFSMTRPSTRHDAVHKAHAPAAEGKEERGIREWIAAAEASTVRTVTYDTRVKKAFIPGSAAKSAAKSLREHGFADAGQGETFWVEDTAGPLKPGEVERARAWGRSLVG